MSLHFVLLFAFFTARTRKKAKNEQNAAVKLRPKHGCRRGKNAGRRKENEWEKRLWRS